VGVVSGALAALLLVVTLFIMAGFFYLFIAGVHYKERLLSRAAALAFLAAGVLAVVLLVRVVL
jgi:hypothetical protein